jgi:HEAT repeat protein
VIGLGLRQLQEALHHKADEVQREFVEASEELDLIGRQILEARGEERGPLRERQLALRERQQQIAGTINEWRERARAVLQQRGSGSLRAFIQEMAGLGDERVRQAAEYALYLMDAPEEELERLSEGAQKKTAETPAGRLLQRARTEYDLRGADIAARQRAAVEFANRSGMAQDDAAIAEIEASLEDSDPLVRETAVLTFIQLHRFRALRVADLDMAHASVQRLAEMPHPAVVPVLVEIVEKPRTGYVSEASGPVEQENARSRLVALLRLVEWHTAEAQKAVLSRQFDRDSHIVAAAKRALELFPGEWRGPLKGTAPLAGQP